jgi:hypothetical protein
MQEETFRVEDRRGAGFYQIDNELLTGYGRQLGPYGIAAYNALAWHISGPAGGGGKKTCYPGYKRLAELTGMSRNGVIKGLEACRKAGIIEIITGRQDAGGQANTANTYILLPIKQGRGSPQQDIGNPSWGLPNTQQGLPLAPGKNYPSTPQVPEEYPINKTHENNTKRGGGEESTRPDRQVTNPPPPVKPHDPNMDHVAVKLYVQVSGAKPKEINAVAMAVIAKRVGNITAWAQALEHWQTNGYKWRNVADLLNRYDKFCGETGQGSATRPPAVAKPPPQGDEYDKWRAVGIPEWKIKTMKEKAAQQGQAIAAQA